MDDFDSVNNNNSGDYAGKRFDEAAQNGVPDNNSDISIGVTEEEREKEEMKMPSSASAAFGSGLHEIEANNNNAAFSKGGNYQLLSATRIATMEEDGRKVSSTAAVLVQKEVVAVAVATMATRGRQPHRNNNHDEIAIGSPSSPIADNGFVPLKVIHVPNKTHYSAAAAAAAAAPPTTVLVHSHDVHRPPAAIAIAVAAVGNELVTTSSSSSSSVKSFDDVRVAAGSHRSQHSLTASLFDGNTIPEPPPPPPPTTERERLVERERQARLETERARRRHIALQRERQSEHNNVDGDDDDKNDEDGHTFDNDDDVSQDDHDALIIGQISFDEEERSNGIPSPPIPPPPATEKERLVERERQARLETERARRRHLAFQREQQLQLEIDERIIGGGVGGDESDSHNFPDAILPDDHLSGIEDIIPLETMPDTFTNPIITASRGNVVGSSREAASIESIVSSDTGLGSGAMKAVVVAQNNDAEATTNLSYPMERFLETCGDEAAIAVANVEIPPVLLENDASSLPYTMELFLADNAAGVASSDIHSVNTTPIEHRRDSNMFELPSNSLDLSQPPSPPLSTGDVSDPFANEAAGLVEGSPAHSDTFDGRSLSDDDSALFAGQHSHSSYDSRISNLPSLLMNNTNIDSPGLPSRPSRPITEADIAQLAEVEHASIGNAAPQSERDEPSEASIPRLPLLDQAFSVATQTTIIDSVTETSVGRSHLISEENQSMISSTIIRVGESVEKNSSGGASSASIEAVLSNVSGEGSDDDSHMMINPLSMRSDSHSQSLADDSHLSRMAELTEADVVAMTEIDYASIGNTPSHSVRDERLSESSLTERGGRQFSVATPISEMDSIDENSILRSLPFRSMIDEDSESNASIPILEQDNRLRMSIESENTSVEVMPSDRSDNTASHNSMMLSERDDDSLQSRRSAPDSDYMGSSTSIHVSPSVDLEKKKALNSRLRLKQDEDSAPLIPPRQNDSLTDPSNLCKGDKGAGKIDSVIQLLLTVSSPPALDSISLYLQIVPPRSSASLLVKFPI